MRLYQDGMDSRLAMPKRQNDPFVGFSLVGQKLNNTFGDEGPNAAYVDTRAPTEAESMVRSAN